MKVTSLAKRPKTCYKSGSTPRNKGVTLWALKQNLFFSILKAASLKEAVRHAKFGWDRK